MPPAVTTIALTVAVVVAVAVRDGAILFLVVTRIEYHQSLVVINPQIIEVQVTNVILLDNIFKYNECVSVKV